MVVFPQSQCPTATLDWSNCSVMAKKKKATNCHDKYTFEWLSREHLVTILCFSENPRYPPTPRHPFLWYSMSESEQAAQMSSSSVVNNKGHSAAEGAWVVHFTDLLTKGCRRRVKQVHIITIINLQRNQIQRSPNQDARVSHTHTQISLTHGD